MVKATIPLPLGGARCVICGSIIYGGQLHEATKPKNRRAVFFHRACMEQEQEEIRRKRGGRA